MMYLRLFLVLAVLSGCDASKIASIKPGSNDPKLPDVAALTVPPGAAVQTPRASHAAQARLQAAIATYLQIAARGGWPAVPAGGKLEIGSYDPRVAMLRDRLSMTGDLKEISEQRERFDLELLAAVRIFQARHGLEMDGIVGPRTLAALNVPVEHRLATLELNLSRMQGEKQDWGDRYIAVNAAAAQYSFIEGGEEALAGPTIVGMPSWATPRIDSVIDRLEFNPYWTVPSRIAAREVWPKAHRDAGYLRRNHMRIINGQIRQDPGPDNPLGKVKFLFPNPYSVYLHDTSHPELFERAERFRSHGCIRVSGALDLARALLRDDPDWPTSRIDEALVGVGNVKVRLAYPIAVHVFYDTAWVDEAGLVQFRNDVYGRDRLGATVPATAPDLYGD